MIDMRTGVKGRSAVCVWLLMGGVLGWAVGRGSGSGLLAQQPPNGPRSAAGMHVQITGTPGQTQWLTLVNPETQSLAVYRFEPNDPRGSLKLEAVRHYRWDLMLTEYQNHPPEVSAVESMTRGPRVKP